MAAHFVNTLESIISLFNSFKHWR